jgi:hypothetical protein
VSQNSVTANQLFRESGTIESPIEEGYALAIDLITQIQHLENPGKNKTVQLVFIGAPTPSKCKIYELVHIS